MPQILYYADLDIVLGVLRLFKVINMWYKYIHKMKNFQFFFKSKKKPLRFTTQRPGNEIFLKYLLFVLYACRFDLFFYFNSSSLSLFYSAVTNLATKNEVSNW